MVKKYGFSLCESSEIILLVALYNTEACLRSCETKTHAHAARRSFNIRNTQLYKNPCSISVYAPHLLGRRLHLPGSGPSQTVLFLIRHLQRAGSTLTQETVLGPRLVPCKLSRPRSDLNNGGLY